LYIICMSNPPFRIFAHRGASGYEPENTLRAIQKALDLGAEWIEVDVQKVENELIVFHDLRLERTTNGQGFIWEHSFEKLRTLDAGKGERIPLLSEVMELVQGRAKINIELKGQNTALPVVQCLDAFVKQGQWKWEDILISSFYHMELQKIKTLQPLIPTGALCVGVPLHYARFAKELQCTSLHLALDFVTPEIVEDAHARGLSVYVFTVNDLKTLHFVKSLKVDGVFTDYPDRIC